MRFFAVAIAGLALSVPVTEAKARAPRQTPLPEDVALALADGGIEVVDGSDVDAGNLAVTSNRAVRMALGHFAGMEHMYTPGWTRLGRVTVHLVRVLRSDSVGPAGLFPDQLVWMVVIRDVDVAVLGPPRKNRRSRVELQSLAFFLRTDAPRWIVASTF